MYGELVPFSPAPSRHLFHPSSCLDAAGSSQVLAITISFLVNPEEFAAGKHRSALDGFPVAVIMEDNIPRDTKTRIRIRSLSLPLRCYTAERRNDPSDFIRFRERAVLTLLTLLLYIIRATFLFALSCFAPRFISRTSSALA